MSKTYKQLCISLEVHKRLKNYATYNNASLIKAVETILVDFLDKWEIRTETLKMLSQGETIKNEFSDFYEACMKTYSEHRKNGLR